MRLSLFAAMLALPVMACQQPQPLSISDAWTRDSVGRTANAAVFMTITSPVADRLVGASTPVATRTDLMTMQSAGGTMGMTYLDAIPLPAGQPVSLDPRGLHVWLAGLRQPLKAGESFVVTLKFEKAGEREITVAILAPGAEPPASRTGGG